MTHATDILVLGAGAAGMVAGIYASRSGARVVVAEAADRIGGTFHLSSGMISAAGTRLQEAKGIHDTPDLHFADIMRISRNTANPEIVRLAVDNAADTVHWLLDSGYRPLPDHPVVFFAHEPYAVPRTYWAEDGGMAVFRVLEPQYRQEEAHGTLETWLGSPLVRLLQDEAGAVIGAVVRKDGVEVEILAKAVILATGGYTRNPELFSKLSLGKPLFGGGWPEAQGTGLLAAVEAGSEIVNADKFLPGFAGIEDPQANGGYDGRSLTVPQTREPWELYVDVSGARFMREDEPSIDTRERALLEQPGIEFWVVYDEGIRQAAPSFFADPDCVIAPRFGALPGYRKADTLADLAAQTGMDAQVLEKTIAHYNAGIAEQAADPFGREHRPRPLVQAPYYAVRHVGWSVTGFAGVKIGGDLNVLRASGEPIANLYAAGEILGMGATSGNSFNGGMSVTPAMTFGRLLGTRLGHALKAQ